MLQITAQILIVILVVLHIYIAWFEIFAWEKKGPKIFKSLSKKIFPETKAMAANQGVYNLFLAAGLIWALSIADPVWSQNISVFFLLCISAAGIYGYFTIDKKIIFIQTVPSVLALVLIAL